MRRRPTPGEPDGDMTTADRNRFYIIEEQAGDTVTIHLAERRSWPISQSTRSRQ